MLSVCWKKYAVAAEMQKMLVILSYRLSMGRNCIPSPSHCFKHPTELYDNYPLLPIDRSGVYMSHGVILELGLVMTHRTRFLI